MISVLIEYTYIFNCNTAKEVRDTLEKIYEVSTKIKKKGIMNTPDKDVETMKKVLKYGFLVLKLQAMILKNNISKA